MSDPRPVDPNKTVTVTRDVTNVVTLGVPGPTVSTLGITDTEKTTINGRLTTLEEDVNSTSTEVSTANTAKMLKAPAVAGRPVYGYVALHELAGVDVASPADNSVLTYDAPTNIWLSEVPASGALKMVSPVIAGRYYTPSGLLGGEGTPAVTLVTNNAYLVPVMFDRDGTIDQIGLNVAGAGPTGSTVRMTIYSAGATHNRPDTRLLTTSPAAVALTTTGVKTFTVSLAVVKNTVYYLAVAAVFASGTPSLTTSIPARDWYGSTTAGETARYGQYAFTQTAGWTEFGSGAGGPIMPYAQSIYILSARLV